MICNDNKLRLCPLVKVTEYVNTRFKSEIQLLSVPEQRNNIVRDIFLHQKRYVF